VGFFYWLTSQDQLGLGSTETMDLGLPRYEPSLPRFLSLYRTQIKLASIVDIPEDILHSNLYHKTVFHRHSPKYQIAACTTCPENVYLHRNIQFYKI